MHMRQDVTVVFGVDEAVEILVPTGTPIGSHEEGRRWLDQAFQANGCEPLRASGKVLTADKLLAIAETVGRQRFDTDPAFRDAYARAGLAAVGKPVLRVDLVTGTISA
jgi:hypothetical protein